MKAHATSDSILPPIGRRIIIVGQTCSGKSTLGALLSTLLGVPFVEVDALYWKPGWVGSTDDEFLPKVLAATAGPGWAVAGGYHRQMSVSVWPRADTVVWLDLPLPLIVGRILRRSWQRSRSGELLWGTNSERFWSQLKLWSEEESLVAYASRTHRERRRRYLKAMSDPRWDHIRFIRLRSASEIDRFIADVEEVIAAPVRRGGVRQT